MKKLLLYIFFVISFSSKASVDSIAVFSSSMKKPIKVLVIKPDNIPAGSKLPVVYLLHGYSGNYKSWLKDAPGLIQKSYDNQVILVMPDGGFNSWYLDSPVDSSYKYETFMIKELVPYIDDHYPTINKVSYRAITGLSMGGHGAFYLAIKHKDLFGAAGSICGGVDIRPFPNNWDMSKILGSLSENKDNWDRNTVINMVDSLKNGELHLIFDCGSDDFFLEVNRALHIKLAANKVSHDYIERPGAHNAAYWRNSIDYQLLFFSKFFKEKNIQ
jgi:S-formylglutathione hydrolase FrmB